MDPKSKAASQMTMLSGETGQKRAFYKRLGRHRLEILILILIILTTVCLVVYFPVFAKSEWVRFLVQYLWPSGVSIFAISRLTRIVKDIRSETGYELYFIVKEEIETHIQNKAKRTRFLDYLLNEHDELLSSNKSTRKLALEHLIKKFEGEGWCDPESVE